MPETVTSSEALNAPVLRFAIYIKGQYDTLADLQAAHPTGEEGDAYNVGGVLYVWDESAAAWTNAGTAILSVTAALTALNGAALPGQVFVKTSTGYAWEYLGNVDPVQPEQSSSVENTSGAETGSEETGNETGNNNESEENTNA